MTPSRYDRRRLAEKCPPRQLSLRGYGSNCDSTAVALGVGRPTADRRLGEHLLLAGARDQMLTKRRVPAIDKSAGHQGGNKIRRVTSHGIEGVLHQIAGALR